MRGSKAVRRKQRLIRRDGPFCFWCGLGLTMHPLDATDIRAATIEHLIAQRWGGNNEFHNLVLACKRCNERRGHGRFLGMVFAAQCATCSAIHYVGHSRNPAHFHDLKILSRSIANYPAIPDSSKRKRDAI